jgi:hypothetical protein
MQYMVLIGDSGDWDALPAQEQQAIYGRIQQWWAEHSASGEILDGHRLQGRETATTIRRDEDGRVAVLDGPFVEAKETVGGYAIIDVPDLDAAIRLVSGWPGLGPLEIRPLATGAEAVQES